MARKPPARPSKSSPVRLREVTAGILLFAATLAVYSPAFNGGILWDDDRHLTPPDLQSLHGLWRIWSELGSTQQYYPLLHSAFWLEHRVWGDAVLGYHLVNVLLHASSACLLVAIVRRLRLPGAWLAGYLFALHPVCAEAVAWISEQKSTLSAAFYLAAALCYLRFDETRRRAYYWTALGFFVLALASKTVTATLPAALLVVFWFQRGRIDGRRDALPLLPWFALSAVAGAVTAHVERAYIGARGADFALTFAQRCLLASRAIWFYLGKLIWPVNLTFIYPRWTVSAAVWWQYGFAAALLALIAWLVWLAVRRQQRGPLAAGLLFAGTLFPALGFFDVYPFLYSYVADHFQYLASMGVIVLAAAGVMVATHRIGGAGRQNLAAAGLPLILAVLTWRQSSLYQDAPTLYRATLERNPQCWLAHNNLGTLLLEEPGQLDEAVSHFEAARRLQPNYPQAYNNLGLAFSRMPGRRTEAVQFFEDAVRIQPDYHQAQNNLGLALSAIPGRLPEAIDHLEAAIRADPNYAQAHNNLGSALSMTPGRLQDAIAHYKTALRIQPDFAEAHYNLANALSETPGRSADAILHYREALRLEPGNAQAHNNLGIALSAAPGRMEEAVAEFEAALRIQPNFADAHYNLGLTLSRMPGRSAEAIAELGNVLRINPNFEPARRMLERMQAGPRAAKP
ncbi:MAG TPA: tetratricopeptide repeat protein [Bryobacteraceae bacterium]|nr:tetratricopeptide repeat protein [Bryobacteraceae bacterium]